MTHLRSFMKALKVKWILHVVNGNDFLSVLFNDVVGEQMITMVWYGILKNHKSVMAKTNMVPIGPVGRIQLIYGEYRR